MDQAQENLGSDVKNGQDAIFNSSLESFNQIKPYMPERPERPRSRQDIPRMDRLENREIRTKVNHNISFNTLKHANCHIEKSNSSIATKENTFALNGRTNSTQVSNSNHTSQELTVSLPS